MMGTGDDIPIAYTKDTHPAVLLERIAQYEQNWVAQGNQILAQEVEIRNLKAELRDGAEFLHAFTPAGTPAVDAFIAKWRDFDSASTSRYLVGGPHDTAAATTMTVSETD